VDWTVSKRNEWRLGLFERKVLRSIFGAKPEKKHGEKRYNYELYETLKNQTLSITSKLKDWHGQGT
jgi:hypothetical protein